MTRHTETIEGITRDQRRRRWSAAEKAALVRKTYEPGMSVSLVARAGRRGGQPAVHLAASWIATARWWRWALERPLCRRRSWLLRGPRSPCCNACWVRKPWRARSSRKRWRSPPQKVDCALALVAGGRPMKSVCSALGVAHSNLHMRYHRPGDWQDGRSGRTPAQDGALLADLRRHIAELPSCGYRRAGALLNRERRSQGQAALNHKRIYRAMSQHQLLLPKAPKRRHSSRVHDGQVSVPMSNMRWCSDGFEIKCDSGRERHGHLRQGLLRPGDPGAASLGGKRAAGRAGARHAGGGRGAALWQRLRPCPRYVSNLEFLTDNGSAYIAHETRGIARSLGLKPVTTPVCSPQSNGMSESFVNTFKRDYMSRMDSAGCANGAGAIAWERLSTSTRSTRIRVLKMMSPREFRRRHNQSAHQANLATGQCPELRGQDQEGVLR